MVLEVVTSGMHGIPGHPPLGSETSNIMSQTVVGGLGQWAELQSALFTNLRKPPAHAKPLPGVCHIASALPTQKKLVMILIPVVLPKGGPCEVVQCGTNVEKCYSVPVFFNLWVATPMGS